MRGPKPLTSPAIFDGNLQGWREHFIQTLGDLGYTMAMVVASEFVSYPSNDQSSGQIDSNSFECRNNHTIFPVHQKWENARGTNSGVDGMVSGHADASSNKACTVRCTSRKLAFGTFEALKAPSALDVIYLVASRPLTGVHT